MAAMHEHRRRCETIAYGTAGAAAFQGPGHRIVLRVSNGGGGVHRRDHKLSYLVPCGEESINASRRQGRSSSKSRVIGLEGTGSSARLPGSSGGVGSRRSRRRAINRRTSIAEQARRAISILVDPGTPGQSAGAVEIATLAQRNIRVAWRQRQSAGAVLTRESFPACGTGRNHQQRQEQDRAHGRFLLVVPITTWLQSSDATGEAIGATRRNLDRVAAILRGARNRGGWGGIRTHGGLAP